MIFFIRNLGIILCSIFYYVKLLHLTIPKHFAIRCSIFSILLSAFSIFSESNFPYYTIPLQIILIITFLKCNIKIPLAISITTTSLSYALSCITLFLSSMLLGIPYTLVLYRINSIYVQILSFLLQLLTMLLPFRLKRWRNGMPFLYREAYAFSGMIISFFTLLTATAMTYIKENNLRSLSIMFIVLVCFATLILYHYWQANITRTYQEKLKDREITELKEKNAKLEEEILRLGKIVHKDNSMIPEYAYILRTFLTSITIVEKDSIHKGEQLLERLDRLTAERKGIVYQQDIHCQKLPSTKVSDIDSLLAFKQQTALKENIELQAYFSCDIPYFIEEIINEEDLHTLLTYLLDNAIIATKHNNGHHIMLSISVVVDTYTISVFDNGIPFTTEVLEKWGLAQITTHKNNGGSGIGMLTIYEIAKKYNASFLINEIPTSNQTYTKKVTITFDKKGQYILQTARPHEELSQLSNRSDLQIITKSL